MRIFTPFLIFALTLVLLAPAQVALIVLLVLLVVELWLNG